MILYVVFTVFAYLSRDHRASLQAHEFRNRLPLMALGQLLLPPLPLLPPLLFVQPPPRDSLDRDDRKQDVRPIRQLSILLLLLFGGLMLISKQNGVPRNPRCEHAVPNPRCEQKDVIIFLFL